MKQIFFLSFSIAQLKKWIPKQLYVCSEFMLVIFDNMFPYKSGFYIAHTLRPNTIFLNIFA